MERPATPMADSWLTKSRKKLSEPCSALSLGVFRILFGLLLLFSTLRFIANGWVERFFVTPRFHFSYWGFEFVQVASPDVMLFLHWLMAAAALFVALGYFYRPAIALLFFLFTYVELVDATNFLNHYYLVTILCLLLNFIPAHHALSFDRLRKPELPKTIPTWALYLLRFQIGVVYFYAGLAKLESDWLVHAQPLTIWMAARSETWLIGPLFSLSFMALLFSWAGFLNDLLAPFFLSMKKTRLLMFVVIVFFHVGTHLMFNIGVFPFLMPMAAMLFFSPSWPKILMSRVKPKIHDASRQESIAQRFRFNFARNESRRLFYWLKYLGTGKHRTKPSPASPVEVQFSHLSTRSSQPTANRTIGAGLAMSLIFWCAFQILMPLRTHLYGGAVTWHEQGMRFSWRVMLREKSGDVRYRVKSAEWSREREVSPSRYLTSYQERVMSGQPDMIVQLAHFIQKDLEKRGFHDIEIRADAWVSLNGRKAQRLIDPNTELSLVNLSLLSAPWITNAPTQEPPSLRRETLAEK